jgi:hypothetical protein
MKPVKPKRAMPARNRFPFSQLFRVLARSNGGIGFQQFRNKKMHEKNFFRALKSAVNNIKKSF